MIASKKPSEQSIKEEWRRNHLRATSVSCLALVQLSRFQIVTQSLMVAMSKAGASLRGSRRVRAAADTVTASMVGAMPEPTHYLIQLVFGDRKMVAAKAIY